MGLDVSFYLQSKLDPRYRVEIGEFSKVYFLVNYFGFNDDNNGSVKEISNSEFKQFVDDLCDELEYHKNIIIKYQEMKDCEIREIRNM